MNIFLKNFHVKDPRIVSDGIREKLGILRVAIQQPAPWRDSVRFILELLRPELVKLIKEFCLNKFGMQGSNPINSFRAYN